MLLACSDKSAAIGMCRHPEVAGRLAPELLIPRVKPDVRDEEWEADARVRDSGLAAQASGCAAVGSARAHRLSPDDLAVATVNLHEHYLNLPGLDIRLRVGGSKAYRTMWLDYQQGLRTRLLAGEALQGVGYPSGSRAARGHVTFTSAKARVVWMDEFHATHDMPALVSTFTPLTVRRAVRVGALQLRAGDWFLARGRGLSDEERKVLWFGHVERVVTHVGPDRHPVPRLLVQVRLATGVCYSWLTPHLQLEEI
jgi:hypothetical protein